MDEAHISGNQSALIDVLASNSTSGEHDSKGNCEQNPQAGTSKYLRKHHSDICDKELKLLSKKQTKVTKRATQILAAKAQAELLESKMFKNIDLKDTVGIPVISATILRFYRASVSINRPTPEDLPAEYEEVKNKLKMCLAVDINCIFPNKYGGESLGYYGLTNLFALPYLPSLRSKLSDIPRKVAEANKEWSSTVQSHIEIVKSQSPPEKVEESVEFLAREIYDIVAKTNESSSGALAEIWKLNESTHAANSAIRSELQDLEESNRKTAAEINQIKFEMRTIARLQTQEECLQALLHSQTSINEKSDKHESEVKLLNEKLELLRNSLQKEKSFILKEEVITAPSETVIKKYSNIELEFDIPHKRGATSNPYSTSKQRKINEIFPQQLLKWDMNLKRFKGDFVRMKYIELTWPLSYIAAELATKCAIANEACNGYRPLDFRYVKDAMDYGSPVSNIDLNVYGMKTLNS